MPIKIPANLPAEKILESENIFIMNETRASAQDIRPLKVAILNLMPLKIDTETQLLRLLANTPIQVEFALIHTRSHISKNTSETHLNKFYTTFNKMKNEKFDALIITGAPVEELVFEEVNYWDEICEIMEWSKKNVQSTLHLCWAAQAGLYYHYGINKSPLSKKCFGIFEHDICNDNPKILRGFDDVFYAPHSRHTAVDEDSIKNNPFLKILASSKEAGPYLISDKTGRQFFITGHPEYDSDTLAKEYFRDLEKGLDIDLPNNYFPNDDITKSPKHCWRSSSSLLFSNWLNYYVYQSTPYNLSDL